MAKQSSSIARIESRIREIRGHRVMLDADLAALYGVRTQALLQSVKRNTDRFPADSLFILTEQEVANLRSQNVNSNCCASKRWGGRRILPYAFSEQGVAMLSSVLRSRRAIAVNIAIVAVQGEDIAGIVRVIRQLAAPPEARPMRLIGFVA